MAIVPKSCPRCGAAMRLLGKAGTEPTQRHWECVNRSLFDENACTGYAMTDADEPMSVEDIARSMSAAEARQSDQRDRLAAEADRIAEQLSLRLASEPGIYQYLSNGEYRTLVKTAEILDKLVTASQQQAGQVEEGTMMKPARDPRRTSRDKATRSFAAFADGCDRTTLLERCRALDRYLKYHRNRGANIEKAVDQFLWAADDTDAERAWAALSYRVGSVYLNELRGELSIADFEQYWHDWRASRQVRAAIDKALGQESGF